MRGVQKLVVLSLLDLSTVNTQSYICVHTAAVEACVLHGLKRRAAGFLRSNKVAALFMKVGKSFSPAEELCRKTQELEQRIETKWETHTAQLILRAYIKAAWCTSKSTENQWLPANLKGYFWLGKLLNNSCFLHFDESWITDLISFIKNLLFLCCSN